LKNIFFNILILVLFSHLKAQTTDGETFIRNLHHVFYQAPCKIYSFSQKNTHHRNDSVIRNSVWHEAIEFPDKFRIWFEDIEKGNSVFFRNDSAVNYKAGKFLKARADSNSLLLILGGMYYRPFEEALIRLKRAAYKTDVLSEQTWNSKEVMVVGATQGDLLSNQIWFDKTTWKVLRIIEKINETETMDMRFESYQDWCKGHVETKVAFYRNGKLEQVEEYYDLKVLDKLPD